MRLPRQQQQQRGSLQPLRTTMQSQFMSILHVVMIGGALLSLVLLAVGPTVDARPPTHPECGQTKMYWSESCGSIGSPLSRICSEGGILVNPQSCLSHFELGSRACGFLLLGCSSLCKKQETPCRNGYIGFPRDAYNITHWADGADGADALSDENYHGAKVLIARDGGHDEAAAVEVVICPPNVDKDDACHDFVALVLACREDSSSVACVEFESLGRATLDHYLKTLSWEHSDIDPQYVVISNQLLTAHCRDVIAEDTGAAQEEAPRVADDTSRELLPAQQCSFMLHVLNPRGGISVAPYATARVNLRRPHAFFYVIPRQTHYFVSEDDEFVDVEVEVKPFEGQIVSQHQQPAQEYTPFKEAVVEFGYLASNAAIGIDFVLPSPLTVKWSPTSASLQHLRIAVKQTHAHIPTDKIFLTLYERTSSSLFVAGSMPLIEVEIYNSNATEWQKAHAILASREHRLSLLPWVNEFQDVHAANNFLDAWQVLPFAAGQPIFAKGAGAHYLAVLAEGEVDLVVTLRGETNARVASVPGAFLEVHGILNSKVHGFSAAAKTKGKLLVMELDLLDLHNKASGQDLYAMIRRTYHRQILEMESKRFPAVMFPGFLSTQLYTWKRKSCAGFDLEPLEQVWMNVPHLLQALTLDRTCWLTCLALGVNQTDGACKVRAGTGLAAISELNANIHGVTTIFRKLMEYWSMKWNYDSNSMVAMPYDWRLAADVLQKRDAFFQQVKAKVEFIVHINNAPSIFIAHSLGNNIVLQFFQWLEITYPDSFQQWTHDHVVGFFGLGAPLLGSGKAIIANLVGDSMSLPITSAQARSLGATFGSSPWMLPRPGELSAETDYTCSHSHCGLGYRTLALRNALPCTRQSLPKKPSLEKRSPSAQMVTETEDSDPLAACELRKDLLQGAEEEEEIEALLPSCYDASTDPSAYSTKAPLSYFHSGNTGESANESENEGEGDDENLPPADVSADASSGCSDGMGECVDREVAESSGSDRVLDRVQEVLCSKFTGSRYEHLNEEALYYHHDDERLSSTSHEGAGLLSRHEKPKRWSVPHSPRASQSQGSQTQSSSSSSTRSGRRRSASKKELRSAAESGMTALQEYFSFAFQLAPDFWTKASQSGHTTAVAARSSTSLSTRAPSAIGGATQTSPSSASPSDPSLLSMLSGGEPAQRVQVPMKSGWPEVLVKFTDIQGNVTSFSVDDITSNRLFKTLSETYNDTLSKQIHDNIHNSYLEAELSPWRTLPYRPPVEFVAMVYGINVDTLTGVSLQQTSEPTRHSASEKIYEGRNGILSGALHEQGDGSSTSADGEGINTDGTRQEGDKASASGTSSTTSEGFFPWKKRQQYVTGYRASGDGTVNYASLGWAHAWHLSEDISITRVPERRRPFFNNLVLGELSTPFNDVVPEHIIFHSKEDGYETIVYEVEGLEHRDAVRSPITAQVVDNLVQLLAEKAIMEESPSSDGFRDE